jgi:hypothetical protein
MKLFLAALLLLAGSMPVAAQWLDRPWPGIPRTADGQPDLTAPAPRGPNGHPDLTGVWSGPPPLVRLDSTTLQPWVAELVRQRQQEYYKTRPVYQCQPSGPESQRFAGWKRFLQTPTAVAILNDDLSYRVIHMDGRELEADPFPTWMGYSVGRWDNDTLIVDSVGFNDKTWVSRFGVSHTEALRITERYRRPDFGHLEVDVTFTDPGAFAKPWGFTVNMELAADTEMIETVCERGSEDWEGSLSDAADRAVFVPLDVLARYVGAYTGIYGGNERTYEVSLSDGQLFATIAGIYSGVGLGAPGLDEGGPRPLVPLSETLFEGLGLGYRFVVNGAGEATDLMVIHVSGDYQYSRQR